MPAAVVCLLLLTVGCNKGSEDRAADWQKYTNAGIQAFDKGRHSEAEEMFRAALKESEELSADDVRQSKSLNNLASLYARQSKYTEAEALYKRVIALYEKSPDPADPNRMMGFSDLAALYVAQAKYDEAEALYLEMLKIQQEAHGKNHPLVADTLDKFAVMLSAADRLPEAEMMWNLARVMRVQAGTPAPD